METDLSRDEAVESVRDPRWRGRRYDRCGRVRPAQIAFGGSVHDCVLLNASPFGAHIRLREFTEVPRVASVNVVEIRGVGEAATDQAALGGSCRLSVSAGGAPSSAMPSACM